MKYQYDIEFISSLLDYKPESSEMSQWSAIVKDESTFLEYTKENVNYLTRSEALQKIQKYGVCIFYQNVKDYITDFPKCIKSSKSFVVPRVRDCDILNMDEDEVRKKDDGIRSGNEGNEEEGREDRQSQSVTRG